MSALGQWLLQDKQKDLFEFLFAVVFNLVFLALAALVLWALGSAGLAWKLTRGYGVFWVALLLTAAMTLFVQRVFRIDIDDTFYAYLAWGLVVSGLLQIGWCAFAATALEPFRAAASIWGAVVLHAVGVLSCYVAHTAISAFYRGSIYRLVNFVILLLAYVVFSVWPSAGRMLYG